ncbi:MAG: tetratricopeptide repeat protein [Gammaproteobacteria bacterium]
MMVTPFLTRPLLVALLSTAPAVMAAGPASNQEPAAELDAEVLYDVLLGEIAGQRGRIDIASEALARAARRTRDPRLAERATLAAVYAKQYREALKTAQLWVELRPTSADAREALAGVLLELDRLEDARAEFQQILQLEKSQAAVEASYMRIAAVLGRVANRSAALDIMQGLVKQNAQAPVAHYALAHLAVRAGELDVAGAAIDRALALKPEWQDAALFKARILVSQKDMLKAQQFYEDFLRKQPSATNVRLHYARFLIDQKQWEKARDEFKRVATEMPDDADAVYAVGLLALQTNRMDEAETFLKRALALRPRNDQARVYLGQVVEASKRYAEAARWYKEVEPGESYFEAQTRLAIVMARQNNIAGARAHLHAIQPENEQQRVQLLLAEEQILRDAKQYREALEVLNEGLKQLPDDKDLLYARALVAEKLDMLTLVEADLRAILKKDPKNVNALNALGYTLADRTDRYTEAQEFLTQALELKPDDPFVLDSMGWLQYRLGNNAEAIRLLKRALAIRSDAEIAAHLGEVLWVTGDRHEAESVWTRALKDTPDNEALRGVIQKFKR